MRVNYLIKQQHRATKEGYSYALCTYKPDLKHLETLAYDVSVIEVPTQLSLAQAIKYAEEQSNASDIGDT